MIFYGSKMDVVRFATALQLLSKDVWPSITITHLYKSEVYSVSIATDTLSVDTVEKEAQNYSLRPTATLPKNTQVGLHRVK
jgi:hypothetical protein